MQTLKMTWLQPTMRRMLETVNPQLAVFKAGREQQSFTWEELINTILEKIRINCQCPG